MKKKNGFTLIELLAILVILAIIAVITIPKINKVINESKQNAARNSAYGYKDAIEKWEASQQEEDIYLNGNYTITNGKLDNYTIPLTGSAPSSGYLTYEDDDLISGCLVINGYEAIYQNGKFTSSGKGDCGGIAPSETFLYYTYDPNAKFGSYGKITEMKNQPDPSWDMYVKTETGTIQGYTMTSTSSDDYNTLEACEAELDQSYNECITFNNKYKLKFYEGIFSTIQECELNINKNYNSEVIEEFGISCVEINDKLKANLDFIIDYNSELCIVSSGNEVCINQGKWEGTHENPATPLGGNYIQSKKTEFETAGYLCEFESTNSYDWLKCNDQSHDIYMYGNYSGNIRIENINNNCYCSTNNSEQIYCSYDENTLS